MEEKEVEFDSAQIEAMKELIESIADKYGIEVKRDEEGELVFKEEDESKLYMAITHYFGRFKAKK